MSPARGTPSPYLLANYTVQCVLSFESKCWASFRCSVTARAANRADGWDLGHECFCSMHLAIIRRSRNGELINTERHKLQLVLVMMVRDGRGGWWRGWLHNISKPPRCSCWVILLKQERGSIQNRMTQSLADERVRCSLGRLEQGGSVVLIALFVDCVHHWRQTSSIWW